MLRIADIMTRDVITVSPELGLRDVMELFAREHVSGAPVVAGKQIIGVVTLSDVVTLAAALPGSPSLGAPSRDQSESEAADRFLADQEAEAPSAFFTEMWDDSGADAAERTRSPDAPEWNTLDECTVRDAMTADVLALPSDASVTRAAAFMQQHCIHRVLVIEKGELLGIVTTSDIARAVAQHQLSGRRYVFGSPEKRADGSWW